MVVCPLLKGFMLSIFLVMCPLLWSHILLCKVGRGWCPLFWVMHFLLCPHLFQSKTSGHGPVHYQTSRLDSLLNGDRIAAVMFLNLFRILPVTFRFRSHSSVSRALTWPPGDAGTSIARGTNGPRPRCRKRFSIDRTRSELIQGDLGAFKVVQMNKTLLIYAALYITLHYATLSFNTSSLLARRRRHSPRLEWRALGFSWC